MVCELAISVYDIFSIFILEIAEDFIKSLINMKKFILLVIFSMVLCLTKGDVKDLPPQPTPNPPATTTLDPITTTKLTTTVKPTITTKPTTTTEASTTTVSTTPTTTTTAIPTTIKPTPKPKPDVGTWALNYTDTNTTCIVLKMAMKVNISYEMLDSKIGTAEVLLPKNANYSGSCEIGKLVQNLTLTWNPNNLNATLKDSVTFTFEKNVTLAKFMLTSVVAEINPDSENFPQIKSNETITANHTHKDFITPLSMSYRCKHEEIFNMTDNANSNNTWKLVISNLQMEAFHNTTGKNFDTAKDCESSETPGIVPIAVGCSLAALIIIVLIVYLVGRRRSQARGYLSM